MAQRPTNWAGNLTFHVEHVHRPASLDELRELVTRSHRLRVLGTGHSFSAIADTTGNLVSLAGLPQSIAMDPDGTSVTVAGAVRYGELSEYLHRHGRALHNLGSLPHISVAGSCATATHGSGVGNGGLATAVTSMTVMSADGTVRTFHAGEDVFAGVVVGLGTVGVVLDLTLTTEPTYNVEQYVYEDLPRSELDDHFDAIMSAAYSVSLFTQWQDPLIRQVWVKHRPDRHGVWQGGETWHRARLADGPRHPLPGISPVSCTEQLGVAGPWQERLPHFRLDFTPSNGEEVQSEFFVPREHGLAAVQALHEVSSGFSHLVQATEIRTVAADTHWMSPYYQRDVVAVHFTWVKDQTRVLAALPLVEKTLAPYRAVPHWGKLTTMPADEVRAGFPRIGDFRELARTLDPQGMFRNDFVDRVVCTV
ncbi:FAD-binding protein [Phytoactinopolyspora alkaliphila]|uniref:FAD-binding protein n=1 Tax=Phytoactinopolyspora alkaliphila TaxID=1783498 RepID=A0A6N9YKV8_9ACTN|nr:FAD-binding protein [Phytoactinopolyspora alkaliphila]NED95509.1 FAD-binding protein [Phytoactinopolyspora alkaliphila]